jgi:hypothetical protein
VSGALKLVAGFGFAAVAIVFVELVLAAYPNPWLLAALVGPLLLVGLLALDTARRRRAAARRRARYRATLR